MEAIMADLRALKGQDYVRVKYPAELARLVPKAEKAWRAFCNLDEATKRSVGYQPDSEKSGVGYQPPESGRDPKEHFHVRLSEQVWLRAQADRVANETVTSFIETALELAEELKPFSKSEFIEVAENDFGMPGLTDRAMAASDLWTLRFLNYLGGVEPGDPIAAEHVDKGAFTAHLYESDPGFERFTPLGIWEPVEFGNGETMIIAGLGLQYESKCQLTAMHHRVVANEKTAVSGRISIVCFYDFVGQVYYDKPRWGPTQNFGAGYFYDMPFAEFAEYFQKK